ncbi:DnaT-like ssDNA-binding domain-containing protein [Salinicola sp. JS01]|uniref:helix-turn-helix domain-containing protein n=1 Tax=Salinicola sp. JS01 TaxID=3050071 RepID=UPI00255BC10D|nr:helix-turn-helix domain-containing protein [Salinicola sp. JS01]WIX32538.1 DnaT-like ssDNA-binding domain-containing protein [Salinicola sp. JS01]
MSLFAMSWARQSLKTLPTDVKTPSRLALMLLADYANEEHVCWPSIRAMSEEMGCSVRSVQRAIDLLEQRGLVTVEERQDRHGRQQSNRYRLAVGLGCQSDTPTISTQSGEGVNLAPRGDSGDRGRVSPVTPLEPTKEPTTNPNTHTGGVPLDHAQQFADDGQPLAAAARQFPMTLDWQPDPQHLAAACQRAGLPIDTQPADAQLASFTAHHADSGRRYGAMAWTTKLVDWLRRDQRFAQSQPQPTGGAAHANGRPRTQSRRLSAAEARERDRQQRAEPAGGGACFDGEWSSAH